MPTLTVCFIPSTALCPRPNKTLARWAAPEVLDDYKSAAAGGKKVQATRRTRFATFPPYLSVVVKRCVRVRDEGSQSG